MNNLQSAQERREHQGDAHHFAKTKLPGSFAALAGELWVAAKGSSSDSLSIALGSVLGWRLEEAEDILDSELRLIKGRLTRVGEVEEAAGMVLRYIRAAQEGTSQINLRIMAKVIRGLAARSRPKASDFLRFADAVASLTIDEISVISALLEKTTELDELGLTKDRDNKAWSLMVDDLVPRVFVDQLRVAEILLTASRTGLVTKAAPFKLGPFCTTPLLHELAGLASLDRAIMEEGLD
ncbi:MAG: hypothetical protein ACR2Q4_02710 [Geminicoccaceae bacterium]